MAVTSTDVEIALERLVAHAQGQLDAAEAQNLTASALMALSGRCVALVDALAVARAVSPDRAAQAVIDSRS